MANQLVNIAKYYRFEGWLLNIETEIRVRNHWIFFCVGNFQHCGIYHFSRKRIQRVYKILWDTSLTECMMPLRVVKLFGMIVLLMMEN